MPKKKTKKETDLKSVKEAYENGVFWQEKADSHLLNRTIEEVWWQEWDDKDERTGLVMRLDNGAIVWIQQDDEGNGPGALYIQWQTDPGDQRSETMGAGFATDTIPVGPTSKRKTLIAKKILDEAEREALNE